MSWVDKEAESSSLVEFQIKNMNNSNFTYF